MAALTHSRFSVLTRCTATLCSLILCIQLTTTRPGLVGYIINVDIITVWGRMFKKFFPSWQMSKHWIAARRIMPHDVAADVTQDDMYCILDSNCAAPEVLSREAFEMRLQLLSSTGRPMLVVTR